MSSTTTLAFLLAVSPLALPATEEPPVVAPGDLPIVPERLVLERLSARAVDGDPTVDPSVGRTIYLQSFESWVGNEPALLVTWIWPGREGEDGAVDTTFLERETMAFRSRFAPHPDGSYGVIARSGDEVRLSRVRAEGRPVEGRLEHSGEFFHVATLPQLLALVEWKEGDAYRLPVLVENDTPAVRLLRVEAGETRVVRDGRERRRRVREVHVSLGPAFDAVYDIGDEAPYYFGARYFAGADRDVVFRVESVRIVGDDEG